MHVILLEINERKGLHANHRFKNEAFLFCFLGNYTFDKIITFDLNCLIFSVRSKLNKKKMMIKKVVINKPFL